MRINDNEVQITSSRHPEYANSSKLNLKFSYERRNYETLMRMLEIFDVHKLLIIN